MRKLCAYVFMVIMITVSISIPTSAKTYRRLPNGFYGTHSDCGLVKIKKNKIIISSWSGLYNIKTHDDVEIKRNNTFKYSSKCKFYIRKSWVNFSTGAEKTYKWHRYSKSKMLKIMKKYKYGRSGCNYGWDFKIKKNRIVQLRIDIVKIRG